MNCLNRQKNQTGRSMVEMLGALALIGILSVAGLTAYRYTMRRYRITTTIQQISLAIRSARGLELKQINAENDVDEHGCLRNINWVMQGLPECRQTDTASSGFVTAIGACVSVCRDNRNIWYMNIEFDTENDPDNIITKTDCENVLTSEIAQDGFLDDDMNLHEATSQIALENVCNMLTVGNNNPAEAEE